MPKIILDFLEKIIDLNNSVNFNGEYMTWRELLSSNTGLWFILIIIGIPLILFGCFIWQGKKRRHYANTISKNKGETIGEISAIYWKQTNKRSNNESTQGTNYAKINYYVNKEIYSIKTIAGDLKSQEQIKVFYSRQNPEIALIERDYNIYIKDSWLKGALSFIYILIFFAIFIIIVIQFIK